ncbi:SMI1/KNR4 family protein [Bacillus sp. REN10]|uniref:SMI1/KNR4 family protein n=1 Tax=Bacillus sp. REN10 TaxID=2782541 RepID=UPI00193C61BC|nr:SMI1/KNR4 family protein [Bacillus sp. REN10]
MFVEKAEGMSDSELTELEQQLRVTLPQQLWELLQGCRSLTYFWDLPDSVMEPDTLPAMSGEMGWSSIEVGWFEDPIDMECVGESDDRRYLSFSSSRASNPVMLDAKNNFSVVCFLHEEGEIVTLAPNLETFIQIIIQLYGAWIWNWTDVTNEHGIDLKCEALQQWQTWMTRFLTASLEEVTGLEKLIEYTLYHGIESKKIQQAYQVYEPIEIFDAWYDRMVRDPSHFSYWTKMMGTTAKEGAADWVRSLWETNVFGMYLNSEDPVIQTEDELRIIRARLSYHALPEKEALDRIFQDLELQALTYKQKMNGFDANAQLARFHSHRVIAWMKSWVRNPIDGWDSLFASSNPTAAIMMEWLEESEICEKVAVSALLIMLKKDTLPVMNETEKEALKTKLIHIQAQSILRTYKRKIEEIIAKLPH